MDIRHLIYFIEVGEVVIAEEEMIMELLNDLSRFKEHRLRNATSLCLRSV